MTSHLFSITKTEYGPVRFRRTLFRFAAAMFSFSVSILGMDIATASSIQSTYPHPQIPFEEIFFYDVRILMFESAAKGFLRIRRVGERQYKAELIAETKGFLGFLSGYQKNHYVSEMEYHPKTRRLVTHRFTKTVTTTNIWGRKNVIRTSTEIDYLKGEILWSTFENDTLLGRGSGPARGETVYEDFLSAFFNFRFGAYGLLSRGKRLTLTALPDHFLADEGQGNDLKQISPNIGIRIADGATEQKYRHRLNRASKESLLIFIKVPKGLFGQETGEIQILLDGPDRTPVSVTVEQAILFGDVFGVLRKSSVSDGHSTRTFGVSEKKHSAPLPSGVYSKQP